MNNQVNNNAEESQLRNRILALPNGKVFEAELSVTDVQDLESVKNMASLINNLKKLRTDYPSLKLLSDNLYFLSEAKGAITDGTFFTTIDELWAKKSVSFKNADVTVFNRSHHVTWKVNGKDDDRYKRTADGKPAIGKDDEVKEEANDDEQGEAQNDATDMAIDIPDNKTKEDEVGSKCSAATKSSASTVKFDCGLFRDKVGFAQSAYLMPHSPACAATWFAFVPWVLATSETFENKEKWNYWSECIHGFNKETNGGEQREKHVGIKHFPTNRISLQGPKDIYDDNPCLLIVPILTVGQVKDWKGEGYEAIVLAGKWPIDEAAKTEAAEVYQMIGAAGGTLLFANPAECKTACDLLEEMVRCVCKSLRPPIAADFLDKAMENLSETPSSKQTMNSLPSLQELTEIDVPDCTGTNIKVRKIAFAHRNGPIHSMTQENDTVVKHPAPDPVLLCGKATCNWLKRLNTPFLAACDDSSTSDSADYVATYEEEKAVRGWATPAATPTKCNGVVLFPSDTFDESLSDLDDE